MGLRAAWRMPLVVLAGCTASKDLVVDLRTDYLPGVEFSRVETELVLGPEGSMAERRHSEVSVSAGDDLVRGRRVAEFADVQTGTHLVRVRMLDHGGARIAGRNVRIHFTTTYGLTVVITRDCGAVPCPGAGDPPEATECFGGRCVPPECGPSAPGLCGEADCSADDDCPSEGCTTGVCVMGACLLDARDELCMPGQRCSPLSGCIDALPDAGTHAGVDAGRDASAGCSPPCADSEMCCGGACVPAGCDDANPCTDDSCGAEGCVHAPNTAPCDDGLFCNGSDTCGGGSCSTHSGNPCAGMATCDEGMDRCTGCSGDSDCGPPVAGPWSPCGGFSGTCDETGTQSRTVTTFRCVEGSCEGSVSPQTRACTRSTDGDPCFAGDICTVMDTCSGGVCVPGPSCTCCDTCPPRACGCGPCPP